jgi:hypothetical protein
MAVLAGTASIGAGCVDANRIHGGRILIQRRIDNLSMCGDPVFAS